jgi:hypothetical protein
VTYRSLVTPDQSSDAEVIREAAGSIAAAVMLTTAESM